MPTNGERSSITYRRSCTKGNWNCSSVQHRQAKAETISIGSMKANALKLPYCFLRVLFVNVFCILKWGPPCLIGVRVGGSSEHQTSWDGSHGDESSKCSWKDPTTGEFLQLQVRPFLMVHIRIQYIYLPPPNHVLLNPETRQVYWPTWYVTFVLLLTWNHRVHSYAFMPLPRKVPEALCFRNVHPFVRLSIHASIRASVCDQFLIPC